MLLQNNNHMNRQRLSFPAVVAGAASVAVVAIVASGKWKFARRKRNISVIKSKKAFKQMIWGNAGAGCIKLLITFLITILSLKRG